MDANKLSDKLLTKLRELSEKPDGWGDIRMIEPEDARAILAAIPSDAAQAPANLIDRLKYFLSAWGMNGVGSTVAKVQDSPDTVATLTVNDLSTLLSVIEPDAPVATAAAAPSEREARALRLLEIVEPILEGAAAGQRVTMAAGTLLRQVRAFLPDSTAPTPTVAADAAAPSEAVRLPKGWSIECRHYEENPDADEHEDTTYTLRGPNRDQAIYYDIDGCNGVAHRFLKDMYEASLDAAPVAPAVGASLNGWKFHRHGTGWMAVEPKGRCHVAFDRPECEETERVLARLCATLAAPTPTVAADAGAPFEWPRLPRFPSPTIRHANGSGYFTEHQMQGYANEYGELVRAAAQHGGAQS